MRNLSELIAKYPEEFQAFRNGTSLNLALGRAEAKQEELSEKAEDYAKWLDKFTVELQRLPVFQIISENKQQIMVQKLDALSETITKLKPLFQ